MEGGAEERGLCALGCCPGRPRGHSPEAAHVHAVLPGASGQHLEGGPSPSGARLWPETQGPEAGWQRELEGQERARGMGVVQAGVRGAGGRRPREGPPCRGEAWAEPGDRCPACCSPGGPVQAHAEGLETAAGLLRVHDAGGPGEAAEHLGAPFGVLTSRFWSPGGVPLLAGLPGSRLHLWQEVSPGVRAQGGGLHVRTRSLLEPTHRFSQAGQAALLRTGRRGRWRRQLRSSPGGGR